MAKEYIVLHHSATPDGIIYEDFDAIKRGHLARGYRDIGYHWVIELVNGVLTAAPGRPEWDTGAHCPGRNTDGIGVCCVGNFQETVPSEELYQFVSYVCRGIMQRHPIKEIGGHRDYYATACPGKNFDVEKIKRLIKGGINVDKTPCSIDIGGKIFPGYLKGGRSYFGEGVAVVDVVKAITPVVAWDEKKLTVKVSLGGSGNKPK